MSTETPKPQTISPPFDENALWAPPWIERMTWAQLLVVLALMTIISRIFYCNHLYQDDGLWFTTAEEMLGGQALYREIYFDKPPGLPLLYAGLFRLFGPHLLTVRIFTLLYVFAISVLLCWFVARFYGKNHGKLAAVLFTVFSTTYFNGHMQGLNTDFLMVMPYAAAAFLFISSITKKQIGQTFTGGVLTGISFQINPKGIFGLVFFYGLLIVTTRIKNFWTNSAVSARGNTPSTPISRIQLFVWGTVGFIAGSLPFLVFLLSSRSISDYWTDVWKWGIQYAGYTSLRELVTIGWPVTLGYFALNNTLLFTLIYLALHTIKQARHYWHKRKQGDPEDTASPDDAVSLNLFHSDCMLLFWFGVSTLGLGMGARFYGHYYFLILPSLCVIGARSLLSLYAALQQRGAARRKITWAVLTLGLLVTLIRFHTRTLVLAADWVRGEKSDYTKQWFHDKLNREEREAAALVRGVPVKNVDRLPAEALRTQGPRIQGSRESSDYLFVWGYRPEIYYWSGLIPASRYLSSQPLTGIPADFNYKSGRPSLPESKTAAARAELVRELDRTLPLYIVDDLSPMNPERGFHRYPELQDYLRRHQYQYVNASHRFSIWRKTTKPGS